MVRVTVNLGTVLQIKTSQGLQRKLEITLAGEATLGELIKVLGLDVDPDNLLLAVNGRAAKLDTALEEGDQVHLMMPISGG
jgi:sulfur carrier protein ThiS